MINNIRCRRRDRSSLRWLLAVRARVQHYSPPAVRSLVYDTLIRRTRARARLARERTHTQTSTTQTREAGEGERGATHKHRGWMSAPYRAATRRAARWIYHHTHPPVHPSTQRQRLWVHPRACVLSTLFRYTAIIGIFYGPRNDYLVASLFFFHFLPLPHSFYRVLFFTPNRFNTRYTSVPSIIICIGMCIRII